MLMNVLVDYQTFVCGFGNTVNKIAKTTEGVCRVEMQKVEARNWPLLIKRPSGSEIDPMSQFMLGVEKEASGHPWEAWSFFKKAAERGYVHAVILVADSLLNDVNPYRVRKDEEEAIRLLQSIPEDRKRPPIRVVLSSALREVGRIAEGKAELEKAGEESPDARKELIRVLTTLPDPTGENLAERVHHLELLAANDDVEALQMLAKCYASGKGCAKNRERAKQLAHRAHELDPSIPPAVESSGIATNVAVAVAIGAVFLGTVFTVWHFRSQK